MRVSPRRVARILACVVGAFAVTAFAAAAFSVLKWMMTGKWAAPDLGSIAFVLAVSQTITGFQRGLDEEHPIHD